MSTQTVGLGTESSRPPRAVPLAAVAGRRWGLALLGTALVGSGVTWLLTLDTDLSTLTSTDTSPATRPLGLLVLPGVALLGLWWRGVLQLRSLLAEGHAAPAEILSFQRLQRLPEQDRIAFTFRDDQQQEHRGIQVVHHFGPEGHRIWRGGHGLAVIYDPKRPQSHHRLVAPERLQYEMR